MDSLYFQYVQAAPSVGTESRRALLVASLWMRTGFVGATTLITGLILLFNGGATPMLATAVALGGGALAALAWRRAWAILVKADEHEEVLRVDPRPTDRDIATEPTTRGHATSFLPISLYGKPPTWR